MISVVLYWTCAATYAAFAALIMMQVRKSRSGWILSGAVLSTAVWAVVIAATLRQTPLIFIDLLDLVRSLTWYGFVLHVYRRVAVGETASRVFSTMAFVGLLMVALLAMTTLNAGTGNQAVASAAVVARLGVAVCALLLLENLWHALSSDSRWHFSPACVALGALSIYDILMSADVILTHAVSPTLFAGHALTSVLVLPLLAVSAVRYRTWQIDIHVSRTAAFHTATLVVCGLFLLSLAAAGELFRGVTSDEIGRDWGGVAELGLIFAGVLAGGIVITSGSARSWIRRTIVDHFFSSRYDYRREWIRCISTLSASDVYVALHVRAIRALGEVVDSPGGALYLADGANTAVQWAGSWNMEAAATPLMPDHLFIAALREAAVSGDAAVEMATWREDITIPEPLARAWLAIPLSDKRGMIGFVVLAYPRAEFRLDREVSDMLKTVGRMVASFIGEQRLTEMLTQTRQLHDYGKRFSFVAHDIKNISSQLSMLLANAETHIQNPEFQRDMLGTVRSSVHKIATLLRRLQKPEGDLASTVIDPSDRLAAIITACARDPQVCFALDDGGVTGKVPMSAAAFDAVLTHLLENAADASAPGSTVRVKMRREALRIVIDLVDQGTGMTREFVRDELFRPFATSRKGGTGIGVFQARELVRQAGGDLLAMSQVGAGTTMRLVIPLALPPQGEAEAARLA